MNRHEISRRPFHGLHHFGRHQRSAQRREGSDGVDESPHAEPGINVRRSWGGGSLAKSGGGKQKAGLDKCSPRHMVIPIHRLFSSRESWRLPICFTCAVTFPMISEDFSWRLRGTLVGLVIRIWLRPLRRATMWFPWTAFHGSDPTCPGQRLRSFFHMRNPSLSYTGV